MAGADTSTYLVAGSRPWNRVAFDRFVAGRPATETWRYVDDPADLVGSLASTPPDRVFFLHWSWIVPADVTDRWECVCFHMTDLPYGRGGSPLQNLILQGHEDTVLTALRMTPELDAGPVYLKRPLSLQGTAQEIYERATDLSLAMVDQIIRERPVPRAQEGEVTVFTRRSPEQSVLPTGADLRQVADFVRMLDADGYPRAFVDHGELRLELSGAQQRGDRVEARVVITRREPTGDGGGSR